MKHEEIYEAYFEDDDIEKRWEIKTDCSVATDEQIRNSTCSKFTEKWKEPKKIFKKISAKKIKVHG